MMNRKFSTREIVLLIILAFMLVGLFYYEVVYKQTEETIASYDTANLDDELLMQQTKAMSKQKMESEMASGTLVANGIVASYNNLTNEMDSLNVILAGADTYTLDFSEAVETEGTVRRNISISFHTGSYDAAQSILQQLHDCQYRCLVRDVSITSGASNKSGIKESNDLNVSCSVTFYETTYNSDSTAGLQTGK